MSSTIVHQSLGELGGRDVDVAQLKSKLSTAIEKICQQCFIFVDFVSIAGRLTFKVDDTQKTEVGISQMVLPGPLPSPAPPLYTHEELYASELQPDPVPAAASTELSTETRETPTKVRRGRKPKIVLKSPNTPIISGAQQMKLGTKRKRGRPRKSDVAAIVDSITRSEAKEASKSEPVIKQESIEDGEEETPKTVVIQPLVEPPADEDGGADDDTEVPVERPDDDYVPSDENEVSELEEPELDKEDKDYSPALRKIKIKQNDKKIPCQECKKEFTNEEGFKKHMKAAHSNVWKCPLCTEEEVCHSTKKKLLLHMKNEHKIGAKKKKISDTVYPCDSCKMVMLTEEEAKKHNDELHCIECHICNEKFLSWTKLVQHRIERHESLALKEHTCIICNAGFESRKQLEKHQEVHVGFALGKKIDNSDEEIESNGTTQNSDNIYLDYDESDQDWTPEGDCEMPQSRMSKRRRIADPKVKMFLRKIAQQKKEKQRKKKPPKSRSKTSSNNSMNEEREGQQRSEDQTLDNSEFMKVEASDISVKSESFGEVDCGAVCPICSKVLQRKGSLGRHLRLHSEKPYQCPRCVKSFVERNKLKSHILRIHPDEPIDMDKVLKLKGAHICEFCQESFSSQKAFKNHVCQEIQIGDGETVYRCIPCDESFLQEEIYKDHIATWHPDVEPQQFVGRVKVEIEEDTKTDTMEGPTVQQIKEEVDPEPLRIVRIYSLNQQRMRASKRRAMDILNKMVKPEIEDRTCKICEDKVFHHRSAYLIHHLKSHNTSFKCEICNQTFHSKTAVNHHRRMVHLDRNHKCHYCELSFPSMHTLTRHLHKDHNKTYEGMEYDPSSKQCSTCGKEFNNAFKLRCHMREHTGALFYCDVCHKGFKVRHKLKLHYRSAHEGVRFQCELCSNRYTTKEMLKKHMKKHNAGISPTIRVRQNLDAPHNLICPFCNVKFESRKLMIEHRRKQHLTPARSYQCNECGKIFSRPSRLEEHERIVHRGQRFQCEACGKVFNTKRNVYRHQRSHHPGIKKGESIKEVKKVEIDASQSSREFAANQQRRNTSKRRAMNLLNKSKRTCEPCNKIFSSEVALKRHSAVYHKEGSPYQCTKCDDTFLTKRALYNHLKLHITTPYKCPDCTLAFSRKSSLTMHMQMVHKKKLKKTQECVVCNKILSDSTSMTIHMREHTGERFYCEQCGKAFKEQNKLKRHIKTKHEGLRYTCDICSNQYTSQTMLNKHKEKHERGENTTVYVRQNFDAPWNLKCHICSYEAEDRKELIKHRQKEHTQPKTFVCEFCAKIFHKNYLLQKHIQFAHKGIGHECPLCDKMYPDKQQLRKHIDRHKNNTIERRRVRSTETHCKICDKQFADHGGLQRHNRIHNGNFFVCETCGQRFIERIKLKHHIQSQHLNIRWKCQVCKKDYATEKYLRDHLEEHYEKYLYHCDLCGRGFASRSRYTQHVNRHDKHESREFVKLQRGPYHQAALVQQQFLMGDEEEDERLEKFTQEEDDEDDVEEEEPQQIQFIIEQQPEEKQQVPVPSTSHNNFEVMINPDTKRKIEAVTGMLELQQEETVKVKVGGETEREAEHVEFIDGNVLHMLDFKRDEEVVAGEQIMYVIADEQEIGST